MPGKQKGANFWSCISLQNDFATGSGPAAASSNRADDSVPLVENETDSLASWMALEVGEGEMADAHITDTEEPTDLARRLENWSFSTQQSTLVAGQQSSPNAPNARVDAIESKMQAEREQFRNRMRILELERGFEQAKQALHREQQEKAAIQEAKESRMLNCAVCLDRYVEPRQLPCGHSYCTACLEGIRASLGGSSIKCPMQGCEAKCTTLVKNLPLNITVKALVDEEKVSRNARQRSTRTVPQQSDNESFEVFVRGLVAGHTYTICELTSKTSVLELKHKIQVKVDMPTESQRLIYAGKQLENDKLLEDYNIGQNATVDLTGRCLGGN